MKHPFEPSSIRCIVGIGNPEARYANTYHNMGLRFVSFLSAKAEDEGVLPKKTQRDRTRALSTYPSGVLLARSRLSMNLSGQAVRSALSTIPPEKLLLVHDDSDLALGAYRVSFGSGSAGHKGVQSVIEALGTREFFRLRLGIREPVRHSKKRAEDFVLGQVPASEEPTCTNAFSSIIETYELIRFLS
ncbi:MAG: aminoacyl-tRNA hydrolase [Patescibacteria group bacterium]